MKLGLAKQPIKELMVEGVGLLSTIFTATWFNTVIDALIPENLSKGKKIACAIGATCINMYVTSKTSEFIKEETKPAIDALVDIFDDDDTVQLPGCEFESMDDIKTMLKTMAEKHKDKGYVTVGYFLDTTVEDEQAAAFDKKVRNEYGWAHTVTGTVAEKDGTYIFTPAPCVHLKGAEDGRDRAE